MDSFSQFPQILLKLLKTYYLDNDDIEDINLPRHGPVDMTYTNTGGTTEVRDVCGTKSAG